MRKLFCSLFVCCTTVFALQAQQKDLFKAAVVGFYNVENLYDTINNPLTDDEEFLPESEKKYNSEAYFFKIDHLADVIARLGIEITPDGLAALGMCEIESQEVLVDLINHKKLKDRHYKIVHFDSPDRRGVDAAFIYQEKYLKVISARPYELVQFESDTVRRYTRDILYVCGILDKTDTIHFLVNHWPSRRGGESSSKQYRNGAAALAKQIIDSITLNNPTAKVILMGDLNDDPINESVAKVLGAQKKVTQVQPRGLYNAMYPSFKEGIGTLAYNDSWNLFDQMVLSYGLVSKLPSGYAYHSTRIFNEPWLAQKEGAFKGYPWRTYIGNTFAGGYSDHFPVYITLAKRL